MRTSTGIAPQGWVIASVAAMYVDFCVWHGIPRHEVLSQTGLDEATLGDPDGRVPDTALFALWRIMTSRLGGMCLPVAIGQFWEPHRIGLVGELLRHAPNALHAHYQFGRYNAIVDPFVRAELVPEDDLMGLVTRHTPQVHALGLPIEVMLAIKFRMLADAAEHLTVRRVTFSHGAVYPVTAYEQFFGAPVLFGAEVDALWVPVEELERPFPRSDRRVLRYLEMLAESTLTALPTGDFGEPSLIDRVRAALADDLGGGDVERGRVAKRLAMSERTLQRRLAEAGTSFQLVLDDVRRTAAESLLAKHRVSILEAVFALGYSNAASFYKAFRRWHGMTPQRWRERAVS